MVQATARLEIASARSPEASSSKPGEKAAVPIPHLRAEHAEVADIEYYLDDVEDLRCGIEALKDPADLLVDWAEVRDALLTPQGRA